MSAGVGAELGIPPASRGGDTSQRCFVIRSVKKRPRLSLSAGPVLSPLWRIFPARPQTQPKPTQSKAGDSCPEQSRIPKDSCGDEQDHSQRKHQEDRCPAGCLQHGHAWSLRPRVFKVRLKKQATPVCNRPVPGIQRVRSLETVLTFVGAKLDIELTDGLNRGVRALPALAEISELVVRYCTLNQLVEGFTESRSLFSINHLNDLGWTAQQRVSLPTCAGTGRRQRIRLLPIPGIRNGSAGRQITLHPQRRMPASRAQGTTQVSRDSSQ